MPSNPIPAPVPSPTPLSTPNMFSARTSFFEAFLPPSQTFRAFSFKCCSVFNSTCCTCWPKPAGLSIIHAQHQEPITQDSHNLYLPKSSALMCRTNYMYMAKSREPTPASASQAKKHVRKPVQMPILAATIKSQVKPGGWYFFPMGTRSLPAASRVTPPRPCIRF